MIEEIKLTWQQRVEHRAKEMLSFIQVKYGTYFLTETVKEIVDDCHPFDRSGTLVDIGEIYKNIYSSFFHFLEEAHNGQTSATFISGSGICYDTYADEIEASITDMVFYELHETVKQFIATGKLEKSQQEDESDVLERVDDENELDMLVWELVHNIMHELERITLHEAIHLAYTQMSEEHRTQYERIRDAYAVMQAIKSLPQLKIVTIHSSQLKCFEVSAEGVVYGQIRASQRTFQKELLDALCQPNTIVIVRNVTNIKYDEQFIHVIYGFRNEAGMYDCISKETVQRSFDEILPNERFKELELSTYRMKFRECFVND